MNTIFITDRKYAYIMDTLITIALIICNSHYSVNPKPVALTTITAEQWMKYHLCGKLLKWWTEAFLACDTDSQAPWAGEGCRSAAALASLETI